MTPHPDPARPAAAPRPVTDRAAPPPQPLRVVVADPDPAAQAFYRDALPALGHHPPCPAATTAQLLELCRAVCPDLVVVDAALADGLAAACRERAVPVVLTAADPAAAAADGPVLAVVPKPLTREALAVGLAAAVRCFALVAAARQEAAGLRQQLEDRKLIERAKGAVVRYCGLGEDEAYRRLRRLATCGSRKMVDVAREVLAAAEVFARLAEDGPHDGPAGGPRHDRPHADGHAVGPLSFRAGG